MTVYILEDEINILNYIISLVEDIPYLKLVGYAQDIEKGKKDIVAMQPELILADIQLRDGNSFTLFNEIELKSQIIFITAFDQYAVDALNLGAFGYLLKPVDPEKFEETAMRCYQNRQEVVSQKQQLQLSQNFYENKKALNRIALPAERYTQIVNIEDILYCQSDKGYTTFYLKDGDTILVSKILKEYERLLPADLFVRCHQSYLVNLNYIKRYFREGEIEMINGNRVYVSERKKHLIVNYLNNLM